MRSQRWVVLYVFLAALAVRIVFVATRSDEIVFPDSHDYDSIARNLLKGKGFVEAEGPRCARSPVYPLVLAAFYAVGLDDPRAIYVFQAFVGAATCVLVVLLGRRMFGQKVGLVAGWIAAFYPFFIYFTGLLLTETLFIFGLVSFFYLIERCEAAEGGTRLKPFYYAAGTGVLAGAVSLLRGSFLLFPIFVLPFWLARSGVKRRAFAQWIVMILFLGLSLVPWVWRNHRLFGHFIPTTLQVGESLYEANSPYADGGPGMERLAELKDAFGGNEFETNRYFRDMAVRYIRDHPWRFLTLGFEKFRRFWNIVPNAAQYRSPLYAVISICTYVPVLIGAVFGLYYRHSKRATVWLLLSPVIYFTALHTVFVGSIRYRVPVMPFVILLAAVGLVSALRGPEQGGQDAELSDRQKRSRKKWRTLRWSLLGLTVVLVVTGRLAWNYATDPERLRLRTIRHLERITNGEVSIEGANFSLSDGLRLSGIQVKDLSGSHKETVLRVESLQMQPYWSSLLSSRLSWRMIELEQAEVNVELDDKGEWRFLKQLRFEPSMEGVVPEIFVRRMRVRVSGLCGSLGEVPAFEVSGLSATLRQSAANRERCYIAITSEDAALGRPRADLRWWPQPRRLHGRVGLSDVTIRSGFVRSLPAALKRHWEDISPERICADVDCEIAWDTKEGEPFQCEGNVFLKSSEFRPRRLPYPITNVRGRLTFTNRSFRVESIRALAGPAQLSASGKGEFSRTGKTTAECTLNVKVDGPCRELIPPDRIQFLPGELQAFLDRASADGSLSIHAQVERPAPGTAARTKVDVSVDGMKLAHPRSERALENLRTRIRITDKSVAFEDITCRWGRARIEVPGTVLRPVPSAARRFEVRVSDLPLDKVLYQLLPAKPKRIWDRYDAKGVVDVTAVFARAEGPGARTRTDAVLRLSDGQIAYEKFPYAVENVTGIINVVNGIAVKSDGTGRHGPAVIDVQLIDKPFKGERGCRLQIRARGGDLDEDLRLALPERYQKLCKNLKLGGKLDLDLTSRFPVGPNRHEAEFSADSRSSVLSLDGGVPIEAKGARITIEEGKRDAAGRTSYKGKLSLDQLLIRKQLMANVKATYYSQDEHLLVKQITADFCGGKVTGNLTIPRRTDEEGILAGPGRGTLVVTGADVAQILRDGDSRLNGKFDADGDFTWHVSESGTFRCTGTMRVREGEIGELPGMLSLLNFFRLHGLDSAAFHTIELKYEIEGKTFYAREINLLGPVVSLFGKGEIGEDKMLNFHFRPQIGPDLNVPVVSWLVERFSAKAIPVTVEGKYNDPVWGGNWLVSIFRGFSDILAELIPTRFEEEGVPPKSPPQPAEGEY